MALTVSTVIRNESANLQKFLDRLDLMYVRDLVVIDQNSADADRSEYLVDGFAEHNGITRTFFRRQEHGYCELHRQLSIDAATFPWVLVLDTDEWFERGAALGLLAEICEADHISAVVFPRVNHVVDLPGNRVQNYFGDDGQMRLIRRKDVQWGTEPHARPQVRGQVTVVNEPARRIHHEWEFHGQRAKMARVLADMQRHGATVERLAFIGAMWESAIRGFEQQMGEVSR